MTPVERIERHVAALLAALPALQDAAADEALSDAARSDAIAACRAIRRFADRFALAFGNEVAS